VNAANLRQSISEDGGVTRDSFVVVARNGSAENKEMKGFHELLSDEQIGQIYAYVKARSDGRLATGRPHRKAVSP
jgi:mono/diheme cytochrome c family protein